MKDKKQSRLRRAKKGREHCRRLGVLRLSVHKTSQHIYAQVIDDAKGCTIASAATVEKVFKDEKGSKTTLAIKIGKLLAERSVAIGITKVGFDRSGFKYHGRIKALADAAREGGLIF